MSNKISSFTQLKAWQHAHTTALSVYAVTKNLPKEEKFGLTNQMRRASVSVPSNIAEGFNRKTAKDKKHFYFLSISSITELQAQLLIARDLKYIDKITFASLAERIQTTQKILHGLIKSVK